MLVAGHMLSERFELRRRLGAGGMGEVFEAWDRDRGERVALKTLTRAGGDVLARFKREFRALQSTAHPNLVSLRELISDGARWFFTMELVEGEHFLEHVRIGRAVTGGIARCDEPRLRAALRQLVHGVRALHDAGLIHRDIKPSNVMVARDGRVVLLDFGLVTMADPTRQSVDGDAIGTVEYMAPEQAAGRKITEAADWYAVGVMLYEALTGQVPHTGHILQILIDKQQVEPIRVDELAPHAPSDLVALCHDLLRIEPADRPSGRAIARRLGIEDVDGRHTQLSTPSRRHVFVGREHELAALEQSFERSLERPLVHLVVGESGIGKSELVARFARALAEAQPELIALAGRCYERETVPYKAFDGVADGLASLLAGMSEHKLARVLPSRPAQLVRLFPVFQRIDAIARAPAPREATSELHEQRRRMFGALRALLGAIAERRPVVITIDDLQWADADSFLLARELLRGINAPPLLVLATVRGGAAEADAVTARLGGVTVTRTTLGPLTEDECRVLAERLIPGVTARIDVARVSKEAGGHPMFLHELLRHLGDVADGAPSVTLDDALWARVSLLRADARALLEAICVAGAPISIDVAAAACRMDPTAAARAVATLRVALLARELQRGRALALEPYHDRVREAVAGRLTADALRELHVRIAGALEAGGESRDPQLLLRHFMLAGLPERAARYAEEAAQRSFDAHAFDQAADLWATALDLVPRDPDDRRRVLLRLGEARIAAGRGADAADAYLAAAEGADRPTRLECHRHAAEQLLISGRIERGIAALSALLAELGVPTPPTARRALWSLVRARLRLRLRGTRFRERHRREIPDADLLRIDVLRVASQGLAVVESIRGTDFQTRGMLAALQLGHRPSIARMMVMEAMFAATTGQIARGTRLLERAVEIAGDDPEPYITAMIPGGRGMIAYFAGRPVAAVEGLTECESAIRHVPGGNWEHNTARLFSLFALRMIGDFVEMRRRYEQYEAEGQQLGDLYLDSTMRRCCVPMWLAEDEPDEAAREFERATWVPETRSFHVQHFHELVGRGDIALYTGEPADRARLDEGLTRLRGALLMRITTIRTQIHYLEGRLALAAGGPRKAERHARRLAREDMPVARGWSTLLMAGAALVRGDRAGADAHLVAATEAAEAAGMRLAAAVARRRLAELRGDDALAIAAIEELATIGVRAPARMAQLVLPMPVRLLRA